MLALAIALLSVDAPVSSVTIYGDRARVVRGGEMAVDGAVRVELPLLPIKVDPESIRLEAAGAEVRQVEIERLDKSEFPAGEARALLEQIEKLDDELALIADQQTELRRHEESFGKIAPKIEDEPLKPRPRLNAKRWGDLFSFSQAQDEAVQERLRKLYARAGDLQRERQPLVEKAQKLGNRASSGYRVTAALEGHGRAKLKLSYLVAGARWTPGYDLQLQPDQKSVRVSFSGTASQSTGEDWDGVKMTLSTALPATVRALPEIATWKIGEKDRFIPTPVRADRPMFRAPPAVQPAPAVGKTEEEELRVALSGLIKQHRRSADEEVADARQSVHMKRNELTTPAPAASPVLQDERREEALSKDAIVSSGFSSIGDFLQQTPSEGIAVTGSRVRRKDLTGAPDQQQLGIAPPPSWSPPQQPPDSPAALAGGFDLRFDSASRESLRDGQGARRVLLFSETWPVAAERLIEPALSPDAYLVAQLKNPSERTLPRAQAALSVGADPAGTATVPLVAPGQELTLPLGVDRGVKSFRNVELVQSEKGVFSKDDVTRYAVTIEVQNPYPVPIALRIVDQLPLPGNKNIEVELIEAKGAERDEGKGTLTFRTSAPAASSVKVAFVYQLKRPKGFEVHQ